MTTMHILTPVRRLRSQINRLLPRSLFGRSLMIIVTPLILLQVVSTWVFYDSHWDTVTRRLAQSVAGDIAAVIEMMGENPTPAHYARVFEIAQRKLQLDIVFKPDFALPSSPILIRQNLVDEKLSAALAEFVGKPFLIDTRSLEKEVEVQVQLPDGILHVELPRRRLFSSTTYVFILWMVGTSLILFAVATVFMRKQVRPIGRLADAAEAFGKGRDVPDFRPEGASEVKQAAGAFLVMRDRIKRQITQRTEMLAGVSHDLRTPLTRMKLQLALLGDGPDSDELNSDIAEMERMLNGYLAFARGEGAELPVETDLAGLLEDVVGNARREGAVVDLDAESDMLVPLRPDAFRRCLANLIANAQRYAHRVAIAATRRGGAIEITVDDDGPGIPSDKREDVFRPFFRLDPSRNPETGGIGLGLTIARDVARGHGGDLTLDDSPLGGLRARLRLPV
jgi:two-component system osmolarity sensor histidine kinase EnvZ